MAAIQSSVSREEWDYLRENIDNFFLIVISMIVFFMQAGFAFLEAGAVRAKNTTNILMKNLMDSAIAAIIFWVCGYAWAFGEDSNFFLGYKNFFLINLPSNLYPHYFFHFVFAATAATIVSGAMAERTRFTAYFVYSFVLTGFVYPIVVHWTWNEKGWLANDCWWEEISYKDFAGSGVVHMVGGVAGLLGTLALKPRLDQVVDGKHVRVFGHTVPLMCLGAFILIFGFFAFNGGSQASITQPGDGAVIGKILVNTMISGSCGGLTVVLIYYVPTKKFTLLGCINGFLTGMVSICAGCDAVDPWAAAFVGVVGGIVFWGYSEGIFKLGIDDPLDAFAVHYGGGLWGVIAVCLFAKDAGVLYEWDAHSFKQLFWNIFGALVITGWVIITTGPMFFGLHFAGLLRVPARVEELGLDKQEHGEVAYPFASYIGSEIFVENRWGRRSISAAGNVLQPKQTPSSETPSQSDSISPDPPAYDGNNDLI